MPAVEVTGRLPVQPPRGKSAVRSDADKAALAVLTSAATAVLGPAAGGFLDWWATGGADWLGNAILSALPAGWRAQGTFPWLDQVVDPVRLAALEGDSVVRASAAALYPFLAWQWGRAEAVPVPGVGTVFLVDAGWAHDSLMGTASEESVTVAAAKLAGYAAAKSFYDPTSGVTVDIASSHGCSPDPIGPWKTYPGADSYCIRLRGEPPLPSKGDVELVVSAVSASLRTARLLPLSQAYQAVARSVAERLDARAGALEGLRTAPRLHRTRLAVPVALVGAGILTAGAVAWTTWHRTR